MGVSENLECLIFGVLMIRILLFNLGYGTYV